MDKCLEQLAKECSCLLQQLHVQALKFRFESCFQFLLLQICLWVAVEYLRWITILFQHLHIVLRLLSHTNDCVQHISILVRNTELLITEGDDTWLIHFLFIFFDCLIQIPLDEFSLFIWILDQSVLRFDDVLLSLLPVVEVIAVMLREECDVAGSESLFFFLVDNHKDRGHQLRIVRTRRIIILNELILADLFDILVNSVCQVFLSKIVTLLFLQSIKLLIDTLLCLDSLFKLVIETLLHIIDACPKHAKRLVLHLESKCIPLEILQVLLNCERHVSFLCTHVDI